MIVKLTIYQAVSSPSKIEGAGGSMKIQLTFYQNCCYRSGVILPLYPPLSLNCTPKVRHKTFEVQFCI